MDSDEDDDYWICLETDWNLTKFQYYLGDNTWQKLRSGGVFTLFIVYIPFKNKLVMQNRKKKNHNCFWKQLETASLLNPVLLVV